MVIASLTIHPLKRIHLTFYILLFCFSSLQAQTDSSQQKLGIESSLSIGYTGFNAFLGGVYSWDEHQLYLGPKVNLSSFYLPGHSHLGLAAGYRIFYLQTSRFSSFFALDYQLSFYKLYDPYDHIEDSKKNNIQELTIGIGSQYSMQRFHSSLTFGFGAFREKFHTIEDDKANDDFYGYTIHAKLSLQYDLFKK